MAVQPKRSVHLCVFLTVVLVIYLLASLSIVGYVVPRALRADDTLANIMGLIGLLMWAVISFYIGREVYRVVTTKPKRKKR